MNERKQANERPKQTKEQANKQTTAHESMHGQAGRGFSADLQNKTSKQTKQKDKQTTKQRNNQTNKQTNKQTK